MEDSPTIVILLLAEPIQSAALRTAEPFALVLKDGSVTQLRDAGGNASPTLNVAQTVLVQDSVAKILADPAVPMPNVTFAITVQSAPAQPTSLEILSAAVTPSVRHTKSVETTRLASTSSALILARVPAEPEPNAESRDTKLSVHAPKASLDILSTAAVPSTKMTCVTRILAEWMRIVNPEQIGVATTDLSASVALDTWAILLSLVVVDSVSITPIAAPIRLATAISVSILALAARDPVSAVSTPVATPATMAPFAPARSAWTVIPFLSVVPLSTEVNNLETLTIILILSFLTSKYDWDYEKKEKKILCV